MHAYSCTDEESLAKINYSEDVSDIEGNVYHTVTIGTQIWMIENLKTTKFNDGTSIPVIIEDSVWSALSTPGYCFFDNDISNKSKYGILYNWFAVNTGKLAPHGWHIPTDVDWTILENYLITNGYNYDGSTMDNKIAKSLASTKGWETHSLPGAIGNKLRKNNSSGFTALPGGYRNRIGTFYYAGGVGCWWSSTSLTPNTAWIRWMNYFYSYMLSEYGNKKDGNSVRCVRDN